MSRKTTQPPICTYAEDSDEPIDGWNLKTCNTCKIPSSKEGNIE